MGDIARDPDLDHKPDPRSDLEQVTGARSDAAEAAAAEAADGGGHISPLEPTGAPDGVAGTGGETKNQDKAAQ
jgi:hypothetical protein